MKTKWAVVGVLIVVATFVMPLATISAKASIPWETGDVIVARDGPKDNIVRWYASTYWGKTVSWSHAACYVGYTSYDSHTVVETAGDIGKILADVVTLNYEIYSHNGNIKQLRVDCSNVIKSDAADWLKPRTKTLGGETHRYDYGSLTNLYTDHKQVDPQEAPGQPVRADKYYCSELVWAAYMKQGVNIDVDQDQTSVVWPDDIDEYLS